MLTASAVGADCQLCAVRTRGLRLWFRTEAPTLAADTREMIIRNAEYFGINLNVVALSVVEQIVMRMYRRGIPVDSDRIEVEPVGEAADDS